jgi:surface polysaccharide O-acyltransferase-like enzyme
VFRWWTVNIYDSISQACVPLFILLSGALLLQPSKIEPLGIFFKKRLKRIGLPFLLWGIVYFGWRYFVNNETLTLGSILQGIETGPYYHFWFLYMIFGLYLITPILRVLVANSERKILRYSIFLWFVGTAIIPLIGLFDNNILNNKIFLPVGWVGYFILGTYLLKVRIKPLFLSLSLFAGLLVTSIGTYFITLQVGGGSSYFFLNELSANVILTSVSLFLLLRNVSPVRLQNRFPRFDWLIHKIGQNTLPIYLIHVIVLETLQKGYLGFAISVNTLNPAFEIPLLAVITLFISLAIVLLLKKIPLLKRAIG